MLPCCLSERANRHELPSNSAVFGPPCLHCPSIYRRVAASCVRHLRHLSVDDRALDVFLKAAQVRAHRVARQHGVACAQRTNDLAVLIVVLALAMQPAVQAEQTCVHTQFLDQPRQHDIAAGRRDDEGEPVVEMPVLGLVEIGSSRLCRRNRRAFPRSPSTSRGSTTLPLAVEMMRWNRSSKCQCSVSSCSPASKDFRSASSASICASLILSTASTMASPSMISRARMQSKYSLVPSARTA